jgi:hypothetical protein
LNETFEVSQRWENKSLMQDSPRGRGSLKYFSLSFMGQTYSKSNNTLGTD